MSWGSSQNGGYDKSDGEDSVNSDFDFTEKGRCVMEDDFEVNELIDINNLNLINGKFHAKKSESLKNKYHFLENLCDINSMNLDDALKNLENLTNWGRRRTKRKMMELVDGCGGHSYSRRYHKYALVMIPKPEYFSTLLLFSYDTAVDFVLKNLLETSVTNLQAIKQLEQIVYNDKVDYASIAKVLDILELVKILELTKEFIQKLTVVISKELNADNYSKKIKEAEMDIIISKLTNLFDWDDLESSLHKFMVPVTSRDLEACLKFIQVIILRF